MTTFWHFTSLFHLPLIEAAGELHTTESNIGAPPELARLLPGTNLRRIGEHVGPDVVWLFDRPNPSLPRDGAMLRPVGGPKTDKRLVRLTVELDAADAAWWPQWSQAQGIDRSWYKTMARAGRPAEWYVCERPIPRAEWVTVEVRHTVDAPWIELGIGEPVEVE